MRLPVCLDGTAMAKTIPRLLSGTCSCRTETACKHCLCQVHEICVSSAHLSSARVNTLPTVMTGKMPESPHFLSSFLPHATCTLTLDLAIHSASTDIRMARLTGVLKDRCPTQLSSPSSCAEVMIHCLEPSIHECACTTYRSDIPRHSCKVTLIPY